MSEEIACPFCGNDELAELPRARGLNGFGILKSSKEKIYRCVACNTVFPGGEAKEAVKPSEEDQEDMAELEAFSLDSEDDLWEAEAK